MYCALRLKLQVRIHRQHVQPILYAFSKFKIEITKYLDL